MAIVIPRYLRGKGWLSLYHKLAMCMAIRCNLYGKAGICAWQRFAISIPYTCHVYRGTLPRHGKGLPSLYHTLAMCIVALCLIMAKVCHMYGNTLPCLYCMFAINKGEYREYKIFFSESQPFILYNA